MNPSTSAAVLLALILAAAAPAGAQAAAPAETPRKPPHLAVATNPIAIPFGVFTLDVESATRAPGFTVGVGGTWMTEDEDKAWGDVRVMYFPAETPLRGFAIGLTTGFVAEQQDVDNVRDTESAATLGVRMDYDWLVGARKRMLVGIGLGAKRVLRDVDDRSALDQAYGEGRFIIGLTF